MNYELFGRRVEAYLLSESPRTVVIDVLQKMEDCPRRIPLGARDIACSWDCGESFALVYYDADRQQIFSRGLLLTEEEVQLREKTGKLRTITVVGDKTGCSYDGDRMTIQGAVEGGTILPGCIIAKAKPTGKVGNPEVDRFFDYIATHTREVLENCGITITKHQGITQIITAYPNQIRSSEDSKNRRRAGSN